ncbi:hypothetical protein O3W44_22520 [Pantoea sp. LMR881]|uniref:hypothetical protein n=1 Tax=Pantoea sp. LMR881 TaxID=3014336 RepID=UPI0022AF3933|nr:hypothetical protein [Pantoea sp. LMR881]MCZ4061198.1 hypothetical protein [Pantoea sp. LMR881]MCZ4061309.1 hypothetical protein [Pantoea sp. LMR881]
MSKAIRLAKADMELIEKAVMRSASDINADLSLIHTTSPRMGKLVDHGFFDAISPELSGRRTTGYNLTQKGRNAFAQAVRA